MFVLSVTVGLYSQFDGNIDPRNFAAEACRGVYITDSDHAECSFIESRERRNFAENGMSRDDDVIAKLDISCC